MLIGDAFFIGAFCLLLLMRKRINISFDTFLLLGFAAVYMMSEYFSSGTFTLRIILIPIAFIAGFNIKNRICEKDILSFYAILAAGMTSHIILSFASEIIKNRGIYFSSMHSDIWSSSITSTTGMMVNFTLFIPLLMYCFIARKKAWTAFATALICLIYGVIVGSRTCIALTLAALIVCVTVALIFGSGERRSLLIFIAVLAGAAFVIYLMYSFNIAGVKDLWNRSYLSARFASNSANNESIFSTGRWDIKAKYISNMFDYPWGGGKLRTEVCVSYAHDIWLDTWSYGGAISFVILIVYIARILMRLASLFRHTEDASVKVFTACYAVVMMIQLMIEPIIQGAPVFFISVAFIDGIISNYRVNDFGRERIADNEDRFCFKLF